MRFYQMSGEEVAASLSSNIISGLQNQEFINKNDAKKIFFSTVKGIKDVVSENFLFFDVIPLICYLITIIFSLLNQSWQILISACVATFISLVTYVGFALILYIYRKKFHDRLSGENESVWVIRSGREYKISVDELMEGDVLLLRKGMILHGDARIISAENLFADENEVFSSSIPAKKIAEAIATPNLVPEMQENMLWKGSFISKGSGRAIVTAIGENCYIEKTGGRPSNKPHSGFYNKQRNIGQFSSLAYILLLLLVFLIAAICTFRFVELILLLGVMCSFVALNPVLLLTEWNYYRIAENLYQKGAHVRTIEAFDGMNKEKNIYYSSKELLHDSVYYDGMHPLDEMGENSLSYFALCVGKSSAFSLVESALKKHGINYSALDRDFPVYRTEEDKNGVILSLFANAGKTTAVAAGYWKNILPYLSKYDEQLISQIDNLEMAGKSVWLLAISTLDAIPNQLDLSSFSNEMRAMCLFDFKIEKDDETAEKIRELQKSTMHAYLVNEHSATLGQFLTTLYGINDCIELPPEKPCYSLPQLKKNPYVVYSDASPIARQQSHVVLSGAISPQEVIYRVKCMFCGIKRSLGFLSCFSAMMIATILTLFLRDISIQALLYPMLLIKLLLICPCFYLIETVGNCNQYNRSMILGAFCGFVGLVAGIFGFDIALLAAGLSAVFLSFTLMLSVRRLRPLRYKDIFILLIALVVALLPWIFLGGNWMAAVLFACFPPIASYIINLYY